MRPITWVLAIVISVAVLVTGCGKKDATDVVQELDHVMKKLESYEGIGTMTLHSGQQPIEYLVEVRYQDPSYYRIVLTNEKKDIKQIVLRNEDGVFVLTPSLKKVFRFQSDWPENQGQVYLYQTLVRSILSDNGRQLTSDGDDYVFEVAANYQTDSLVRQKIWLNKNNYAPKQVQVTGTDAHVVVGMKFNQFEFGKKFDKNSFDMQHNMTNMNHRTSIPMETMGTKDDTAGITEETTVPIEFGTDQLAHPQLEHLGPFGFIEPSYLPEGVTKQDDMEVMESKDHSVLLRYAGTYHFTILESRSKDIETGLVYGKTLDLGFTFGHLVGNDQKTLTWTYDGIKYRITSQDLPETEMVKITQSMVDQPGK